MMFFRVVAIETEVDKFGIHFGGRISRTGLAVGHKGRHQERPLRFLFAVVCMLMLFAKMGMA